MMKHKYLNNLYFGGYEYELFSLRSLKRMVDKELGETEQTIAKEQEGYQPTIAEKVQDNSNDGKLHISIKKKKLKYNLNC